MFPTHVLFQQKTISYLAVVSLCCESSGTCSFLTERETNTNKKSTKKQSDIMNSSAVVTSLATYSASVRNRVSCESYA